ncbi:hypothetical protein ACFQI7_17890 [Paenibacillus allorhizosphaerae]|uniref:SynChlorMet cassette protein ScmC n=1 Tax=Paenibacillus allorhizosphaerae TaxID=2849866 RepID=A0ABM8VEW8_9BACL|nr:hypothetical protein [Paenibacillus allorhizosphaerae]CAG7632586.1 hypothetical protein PAECIP111802_01860 [Paenibacillus allorhizosphaerae]
MINRFIITIAEHKLLVTTASDFVQAYIRVKYGARPLPFTASPEADLIVTMEEGYGAPFENYQVDVNATSEQTVYKRTDYLIEMDHAYREIRIYVHDDFALKHAMVNLYSAYITRQQWGLLIHSSCLLEQNRAYLFAGHSGAGKSTVVQLSWPRPILSDEATIVKISEHGVVIYNSPFRSDTELPDIPGTYPLTAIQILRQSPDNRRLRMGGMEGLQSVLHRVFYWAHDPEETKKVFRMCKLLAEQVPVYEMYFQKNNTFWEEIS